MLEPSQIASPGKSERRQITVLMTDLVGFTAFVEQTDEEAAFALVSQVSGLTTAAIHRHSGTVKNFTGDGILALFGTPTALEDGPLRACRAALEIQLPTGSRQSLAIVQNFASASQPAPSCSER